MTLMVIKTRSLIVSVQEESGFDKNLDLLLLAEAFHMPKLAKAAEKSLANARTPDLSTEYSRCDSKPLKFSEHLNIIKVSPESLVRIIDLRKPS